MDDVTAERTTRVESPGGVARAAELGRMLTGSQTLAIAAAGGVALVLGLIRLGAPSFWVDDRLIIRDFSQKRRLPIRFFLHTGTIHDALAETEAMREVLLNKGYAVTYIKTQESHNWANWSVRYEEILRWLAGER